MSEEQGFRKALEADRYDRVTRLVYADWLTERGRDDEAAEQRRRATPEWEEADRRLHELAAQAGDTDFGQTLVTYDTLIWAGHDYVDSRGQDYFVQTGEETLRGVMYRDGVLEQFWKDWEVVTGRSADFEAADEWGGPRRSPFSCSC